MDMIYFTANSYPLDVRSSAWTAILATFGIESSLVSDIETSELIGVTSSNTWRFVYINSVAQNFLWTAKANEVWISLLLEGNGQHSHGASLNSQTLYIGSGMRTENFTMSSPFRLLRIIIPIDALDVRLSRFNFSNDPLVLNRGLGLVLHGVLTGLAETITTLNPDLLYPIEVSLTELLISVLGEELTSIQVSSIDRRKATFQRIIQAIEARLHDSDLSLADLAKSEGLSTRAIQKLFHSEDLSFTTYVLRRRLQRTAQDLLNLDQQALLVADIGFRWGFGDPAYFSRVFRKEFGLTPGQFREQKLSAPKSQLDEITRGRPKSRVMKQPNLPLINDTEKHQLTEGLEVEYEPERNLHHRLPLSARAIHWGYFNKSLPPTLTVRSGDTVTIETLTQHATDDWARMVLGDESAENIMAWTNRHKTIDRRGAGPMDASVYGRGAGEGFGVHICSGPVVVKDAAPGDILEIEILDISLRPSQAPEFIGRCFGSNAAVWWGYHYNELLTEPRPREVVTVYEIIEHDNELRAHALYNFLWTPQRDPSGVLHETIDYPGIPVDHTSITKINAPLGGILIPVRPHFGIITLAPDYNGFLDSTAPSAFGGNIDNWRLGVGSRIYLPVAVAGALLSVGDPHAAQGDGEISGTAIECSLTGTFKLTLHKRNQKTGVLKDLTYPLIETPDAWIVQGFSHPNYLAEFGQTALTDVYRKSSLDLAMRDAFRKTRRFLMSGWDMSEDAAISLMSVGVDFGITQVVDGNLGVHATIPKKLFTN